MHLATFPEGRDGFGEPPASLGLCKVLRSPYVCSTGGQPQIPPSVPLCPCSLERTLSSKTAALPPEPADGGEGVVNLMIRLPGGSRIARRFHTSDSLQVRAQSWWLALFLLAFWQGWEPGR